MLIPRFFTSIVLLVATIIILFYVPLSGFVISAWLMCLLGIYELTKMYKFNILDTAGLILALSAIVWLVYTNKYDPNKIISLGALFTWCFIVPFILVKQPQQFNKYIICLLALVVFVPAFYAIISIYQILGPWNLIFIMAIAWVADIGAYFGGRKFGRHKLAVTISPNKSIEGAISGLICVIIYLLILKYFRSPIYLFNYAMVFKFALILTSVGIVGDLFESWLKRVAKVKDSGKLLPGHGGVFDRIDSLLAIVAIAYVLIWGLF
jgi:phosphatidate cytidylyltransferase